MIQEIHGPVLIFGDIIRGLVQIESCLTNRKVSDRVLEGRYRIYGVEMTRRKRTSRAREASRVSRPVEPDGSAQSVGIYPKVFHAVFCLPTKSRDYQPEYTK